MIREALICISLGAIWSTAVMVAAGVYLFNVQI